MIKIFIVILLIFIIKIVFFKKDDNTIIEKDKIILENNTIECVVFDGKEIKGNTKLSIKNGKISDDIILNQSKIDNCNFFIMPGLTDAHTHITSEKQIEQMLKSGITSTYDVAASKKIAKSLNQFKMKTSITTVMPEVLNGKLRVENLIKKGADYIKVMVDMPAIMGGSKIKKGVLQDMVNCAHKNNLKIAAHVTTVDAVKQAVEAGVDILIHVPIGERFPEELAKEIANKNIAVIPTLAMLKSFANSKLYGFKKRDYQDAENAVKLLNSYGVPILVGTDANSSFFVPHIKHGSSVYNEMELLVKAGLTPIEVLQGATTKTAEAFNIKENDIITLVEGRPDKNITDTKKIRQIWINGESVFHT